MIYHFYHCYADGYWATPFSEHLSAMTTHGLIDALDGFYIGIVGHKDNREKVLNFIKNYNVNFEVCAEEDFGWEQITLKPLLNFSKNNDGKILYAHTKGAYHDGPFQDAWRHNMTRICIQDWQKCVSMLDECDAVGCEIKEFPSPHFLGNFWWSHLSVIRKLSPCNDNSRWPPETWLHEFPLNLGRVE